MNAPATTHVPESVTFHNVTVSISGCDPVDAYNRLCTALADAEVEGILVEWETHTYSTFADGVETPLAPTRELFPESRRRDVDTNE
jgi:hypothetical protein